MSRFVVIVLDGLGVGAMTDVPQVRPADIGANTLGHILDRLPSLKLPALEAMGIMNILGHSSGAMTPMEGVTYGCSKLIHDGADTFFGHQEIMGTRPAKPFGEPIAGRLELIAETLSAAGYGLRFAVGKKQKFLVVEEAVTIADNIECDPGQAFNVTAAIDIIPFDEVMKIGRLVRSVSVVPRVITFGGRGVLLQNLLDSVEEHGDYIGINAPKSGVYNDDYHCVHLGYGVDPTVQLPAILGAVGVPVYLLGKVADVIINDGGTSIPMVPTAEVMRETLRIFSQQKTAFICANVQETDLSGHRENVERYADILVQADKGIGELLALLNADDILVVMADHGNDPTIGHPHHTRERVPLLIGGGVIPRGCIGERDTLSDVAATAAEFFGVSPPQSGNSFLRG